MRGGRIVAELGKDTMSENALLRAAFATERETTSAAGSTVPPGQLPEEER